MSRLLSRLFCLVGIHDWREMNGRCCECGAADKFQEGE